MNRTLVSENRHVISKLLGFVARVNVCLSEADELAVWSLVVVLVKSPDCCIEGLNGNRAGSLIGN